MELSHLRYFFDVARTGSFSRGARLAHVSAPAMTKAIRKLEQEIGTPLFVRTTRSTALTPSGEVLREHCQRLFASVESMQRALEAVHATVAGPLRVGALEVFSIYLLPVALCRLSHRHPGVMPACFEMLPPVMEQRLLDGELDVAFSLGGSRKKGIAAIVLGSSPGVLVCGREHALYDRGRVRAAELRRHRFVVPRFWGREHAPAIDQFPDARLPRTVGATIELMQMGIQMTVSGDFLGYFPEVSVRQYLADGRLRRLGGVSLKPAFELCALASERVPMKPSSVQLIEQVRGVLDETPSPALPRKRGRE